jgi:YhcH/YjgK/YiaL family protein
MIFDMLSNSNNYFNLNHNLNMAFSFLDSNDLNKLKPGRIELDPSVFVLVQEYMTKPIDKGVWEAHRRYIDLQYMLSGRERIDFALLNTMQVGEYDADRDFLPMSGSGYRLDLIPGSFVIFYPQDAHKPGLAAELPEQIKKIVIKCAVE